MPLNFLTKVMHSKPFSQGMVMLEFAFSASVIECKMHQWIS